MPELTGCPLCGSDETALFFTGREKAVRREFLRCSSCDLMFVPRRYHLDETAQMERYLTHNNDPEDEDYRRFLSRLLDPLRPMLVPGAMGLDYGAGPGPALATMMREEGFDVRTYDPFFHPDESALEQTYDVITCTETVEHFSDPGRDFQLLDRMLRPSGWLGVMTGMLDSWAAFPDWYYHRDPTHVCFYSKRTMVWIGERLSWEVRFPRQNVAMFRKPAQSQFTNDLNDCHSERSEESGEAGSSQAARVRATTPPDSSSRSIGIQNDNTHILRDFALAGRGSPKSRLPTTLGRAYCASRPPSMTSSMPVT